MRDLTYKLAFLGTTVQPQDLKVRNATDLHMHRWALVAFWHCGVFFVWQPALISDLAIYRFHFDRP